MSSEFNWSVRVYYEDTDAGGVVYYANYLKFYERARTEWLNDLRINQVEMLNKDIAFVVTKAEVDYIKPAILNNQLSITTKIEKMTAASLLFEQSIWRDNELLNKAVIKVACLKLSTFSPCRIPAIVREEFQRAC